MSIVLTPTRQLEMPGLRTAPARYGRVRADSLPEYTRYRDDGCNIHPTCLSCPLPRCRYEEPGGLRAILNGHRDRQIVALRLKGTPVDDLAVRFRVSRRTVFRVLESRSGVARRRSGRRPTVVRIEDRRQEERREAHCA